MWFRRRLIGTVKGSERPCHAETDEIWPPVSAMRGADAARGGAPLAATPHDAGAIAFVDGPPMDGCHLVAAVAGAE